MFSIVSAQYDKDTMLYADVSWSNAVSSIRPINYLCIYGGEAIFTLFFFLNYLTVDYCPNETALYEALIPVILDYNSKAYTDKMVSSDKYIDGVI